MHPIWSWAAWPGTVFFFAVLMVVLFVYRRFHLDADGRFLEAKIAKVFWASVVTYTFALLTASQLLFNGPTIAELIDGPIGNQRMGWLLAGVVADGILRIWSEFR